MGDAAHAEVLPDGGGAVRVHRHFGHVAVVVGIGGRLAAVQVLAVGLELRARGSRERIGLVLFAGQVRAPGREARAAGDPQAVHLGGVHVVVLHERELAGGGVLVEREHGDGEGSLPYMSVLPSCAQVVYSNCTTANTGLPFTPSTLALGTVSSEVPSGESEKNWRSLAGHGRVDDGLVVDVHVAAGEDRAALAVGHAVAGDEEGLVGELVALDRIVAELHVQRGAHGGRRHRGGRGERRRGHRREAGGREVGSRAVAAAAAGSQQGGGGCAGAQGQQGHAGQELQGLAAGGHRGVGHRGFRMGRSAVRASLPAPWGAARRVPLGRAGRANPGLPSVRMLGIRDDTDLTIA